MRPVQIKATISVLTFGLLTFAFSYITYAATAKTMTLVKDGETIQIDTHADTVADVLQDYGITVDKHDNVSPSLDQPISDHMTVAWDPANAVTFKQDGKKETVWTTADTVGTFLRKQDIDINGKDIVKPSKHTDIKDGMTIAFHPSFQFKLSVAGKSKQMKATKQTVKAFLTQQGIEWDQDDRIEPGLDNMLKPDMDVKVVRVNKVDKVKYEAVAHDVVKRPDQDMAKGNTDVISDGQKGKKAKHYTVIKENGKVVKRQLEKTKLVKKTEPKIVAYGTKESQPVQVSHNESSDNSKTMYMVSTAYTADCDGCHGTTATGINLEKHPNKKVIAVDPSVIPLGTKVYVEGYGYAVAGDTGNAIQGRKIDVFFSNQSKANQWGVKRVKIKVLN